MIFNRKFILLYSLLLGIVPTAFAQAVTLYNVNIVDVEQGKIIPKQTLKINQGRITKISKARKRIHRNQQDMSGLYIMPGLIDSHTHWGNFCNTSQNMKDLAITYLADGVTTVRDAGGDVRIIKQYQAKQENGILVGPTVYTSSFWAGPGYYKMIGQSDTQGYPTENTPWNQEVTDSLTNEQLERLILDAKEYGCTGLKLYNDLSYALLLRIIPLCLKHDLKPWAHFATLPATAMEVVKAGATTVSHANLIDGIDEQNASVDTQRNTLEKVTERSELYKEMIQQGTILDPTLYTCVENNMPANTFYTREAYRAGVKIVAGTDYINLKDQKYESVFLDELNLLADSCGMSIPDVLRAATIVGAEVIGKSGTLGIIRKGAEADLLILKENPLESLSALQNRYMLYLDGKVYQD